jgi:hypothetical protein
MDTSEAVVADNEGLVSSGDSSVCDRPDSTVGSTEAYFVRLARASALVLLSIGVHIWIDGRRPAPQSSHPAGDLLLTSSPARTPDAPALHPLASAPAGHAGSAGGATDVANGDIGETSRVATTGPFQNGDAPAARSVAVSTAPGTALADSSRPLGHGTMRSSLPDLARTDHTVISTARLAVWTRGDDALAPVSVPELGPAQVELATSVPELTRANAAVTHASAPVAAAPPVDEEASIVQVLRHYERAVARKDPLGAKAVWPSLDDRALARAFNDLQSHSLALQDCRVTVDSVEARATCQGVATYLPKVGRRKPISASHEWTFNLAKAGGGWHIASAAIQ